MVAARRSLITAGCWLASALGALAAVASDQTVPIPDLMTACVDCHQNRGALAAQLPRIEGQNAEYLAQELRRFRTAHRKGFPMQAMASALSNDDVQSLATELAARPWDTRPQRIDVIAAREGPALTSALACSGCHGASFRGAALVPRLAGQNPEYLARQLRAFDQGHRKLSLPAAALSMHGLSDAEIHAIAHYLAGLDGEIHLDWLAGHWCNRSATAPSEVWWSTAQGGLLIGMHRGTEGAGPSAPFSFMRIEASDNAAVYYEQPSGRPALSFNLVEASPRHAVFASADQREERGSIRWQRLDRSLQATWESGGGNARWQMQWTADCVDQAK